MRAQVAIAKTFMDSYSRLPAKEQKRTREFIEKFQQNPKSPGINFERLAIARDDKVRSVRISQAYRAIVIHPPKDDVYLCAWVDKHDDAYDWVRNKKFEVNPHSGVFQLYDVEVAEPVANDATPEIKARPGLLDEFDDAELLTLGVPDELLPAVRALKSDDELDRIAPKLPEDAAEKVYMLAAGFSLAEALAEGIAPVAKTETVDVEDFSKALDLPDSQRAFTIIEGEEELAKNLDAPLDQWRVFLHPSQRRLVRMQSNGPVRVLGGAGTGKTVVLMHRARYLLDKIFTAPADRLLVTTFTKNLATNLRGNLRNLCGEDSRRLVVTHLHLWACEFLESQGESLLIVGDAQRTKLMQMAKEKKASRADFSLAFLMEEWERVIQAQDIDSEDAYLRAPRVGRGTRLTRPERAELWEVFAEYRQQLDEGGLSEWDDVVRKARLLLERDPSLKPFKAVLADEVQDFSAGDLRLLRALAPEGPDALFLVGDGHQRIYRQALALSSCGIDIRGRGRRLRINYRTTEQIGRRATALLEGVEIDDLDGNLDTLQGYSALRSGPAPVASHFSTEDEESEFIKATIQGWLDAGVAAESICVAARTNSQIDHHYVPLIQAAGVDILKIRRDPDMESARAGVRIATMHRLKGLEFSRVIVAGVQAGKMPLIKGDFGDHASVEDREKQERCLFYVACTRARDELVICGSGAPSPFLHQ